MKASKDVATMAITIAIKPITVRLPSLFLDIKRLAGAATRVLCAKETRARSDGCCALASSTAKQLTARGHRAPKRPR